MGMQKVQPLSKIKIPVINNVPSTVIIMHLRMACTLKKNRKRHLFTLYLVFLKMHWLYLDGQTHCHHIETLQKFIN